MCIRDRSTSANYLYSSQLNAVSTDIDTAIIDITEGRKTITQAIGSIQDKVNTEIKTAFGS